MIELDKIEDLMFDWKCPDCNRVSRVMRGGFFGCQLCENDRWLIANPGKTIKEGQQQ